MPVKRMLVDATHPEETRVVVTAGNKLEEFDFESATRRQLRGNIYLAKVTRVEPSLQAAFVDYGGNRHGFLAFSEIHPDYYQIPVADREALLRQAEEEEQAEQEAEDAEAEDAESGEGRDEFSAESANGADADDEEDAGNGASHIEETPNGRGPVESVGAGDALEEVTERRRSSSLKRAYKIQEVIKRRQVMLVQVVKEERGNKGAALTTYLSLAGRYSVLMPNTARGGGISRKITNAADRKRLKEIVGDLDVPPGQGVILRTAGASRTKAEVKRDFEYLQRLWENVRTLTLRSQAPCLVYEEGSLIKRAIRDLYNKDIGEVLVSGEEAYREAKDFMKMIMPSHARNVQLYKDDQPLFSRYSVESQLDQMFSPQVTLPSGGYLVINPTEALVSIDVNSGRSTREHNIEDTALQTNLEAAEEVARQLRLRDLAGLIVIDFIDMAENRSNRAVERRLKEALKNDRARIQVGRISHFGLLEMSRQRIRFGVVESSTHICPVCQGTGIVRSTESVALMVMRAIEDHVLRKPGQSISVKVPTDVALYVLNYKRPSLSQLEAKYDLTISIVAEDHLVGHHYLIERGEARNGGPETRSGEHVRVDSATMDEVEEEDEASAEAQHPAGEGDSSRRRRRRRRGRNGERTESPEPRNAQPAGADAEDEEAPEESAEAANGAHSEDEPHRRRRRGRRGGRRNRHLQEEFEAHAAPPAGSDAPQAETVAEAAPEPAPEPPAAGEETAESGILPHSVAAQAETALAPARRSRRRKTAAEPVVEPSAETKETAPTASADTSEAGETQTAKAAEPAAEAPKKGRARGRRTKAAPVEVSGNSAEGPAAATTAEAPQQAAATEPDAGPAPAAAPAGANGAATTEEKTRRRRRKELPEEGIVVSSTAPESTEQRPKKAGWWQRGFFGS